jgi:ATP-dependent DNA helicase PIF1
MVPMGCRDPDDVSIADAVASFSREQLMVWHRFKSGQNVFFSGVAGSGKSFLMRTIIQYCRLKKKSVGITASTGIAGVNIGASTLHSWSGIGLGKGSVSDLVDKVYRFKAALGRWRDATALIIDELSMISHDLFDKMEEVARTVRNDERPFGGLQLILCGDFLQLPPVTPGSTCTRHTFLAASWDMCFPRVVGNDIDENIIILTHVFRQSDTSFVRVLNNLRLGKVSAEGEALFQSCLQTDMSALVQRDGIEPTRLFSTKREVSTVNEQRLVQIAKREVVFHAADWCTSRGKSVLDSIKKNCQASATIVLKVGAQVMFLCNRKEVGLVNGSRGVVVRFEPLHVPAPSLSWGKVSRSQLWPVVRFVNGVEHVCTPEEWAIERDRKKVAKREQVPLLLAWALTIHKCQGMTLDRVELSLGSTFENGQGYVALSRVTDPSGLRLLDYDSSVIRACPVAIAWYERLLNRSTVTKSDSVVI